ncbi:MAG: hypothetical protein JWR21_234 [Herminiimonas sp.]|nr:hypothetical protein [Herminiimonas sp.]MDB5852662.1 hypothetical protein [Herminiimonas sp.]
MLVTFKSKAAADVVMYKDHARRILELVGKEVEKGVFTTEQISGAIETLESEVRQSKAHPVSEDVRHDIELHHGAQGDDHEHEPSQSVSFSTRVYPLLEMLRAAQRERQVVAWGI